MTTAKTLVLVVALAVGSVTAFARQDADNTKANKQPQNQSGATADNAANSKTDLQLMKEIRRAVVKDKTLSTTAHNVKIVAKDGRVTLKGPVTSEDEKKAVEQKAAQVAGAQNITNELTVKASQ
jgi:hyperosmotically inducible protein